MVGPRCCGHHTRRRSSAARPFAPIVSGTGYYLDFLAFLRAQASFILAEILALAAALIFRLPFRAGFTDAFVPFRFAHLALAAALILARAALLILNFFRGTA